MWDGTIPRLSRIPNKYREISIHKSQEISFMNSSKKNDEYFQAVLLENRCFKLPLRKWTCPISGHIFLLSGWWFQPIWKIWSSNWIISPSRDETTNKLCIGLPSHNESMELMEHTEKNASMDQPTISWFFVSSRKGFQEIPPIISVRYIYICTAYRYLSFVSQPQTLCIYRRIVIYAPKMKNRNPSQNEMTLGSKEYHDMQSNKVCCWVFTVVGHVCCETCLAQQQHSVQAKYLKSSKF